MFVPVACNRCGKPFQVPDADAGQEVVCPWCMATVPALPVATAAPNTTPGAHAPGSPAPAPPAAEPLSLDDAPAAPGSPAPARRSPLVQAAAGVVVGLLLVAAVAGVLGYRTGRIPGTAWRSFTPPDGSFTVELPGEPTAERLEPVPGTPGRGGELFTTRGWYSGAVAWAGWRDVSPVVAPAAAADQQQWVIYRPAIDAEVRRRREAWNGSDVREATTRFDDPLTVEVRMTTPSGDLVERMMVVTAGGRARVYFVGLVARNAAPDAPAARRLFGSFQPKVTSNE